MFVKTIKIKKKKTKKETSIRSNDLLTRSLETLNRANDLVTSLLKTSGLGNGLVICILAFL